MIGSLYARLKQELSKSFHGTNDMHRAVITALFAGGHVLLEGPSSLTKHVLTKSFAHSISCSFKRVQCTEDLLPTDLTGTGVNRPNGTENFVSGPIFNNILFAEQINLASAKAQNVFLEAMQDGQVTVDDSLVTVSPPFFVIATQDPAEKVEAHQLSSLQRDAFMFSLSLSYPSSEEEFSLLKRSAVSVAASEVLMTKKEVMAVCKQVRNVKVYDNVTKYVVDLIRATRTHRNVLRGASPKAGTHLLRASQSYALLHGRGNVSQSDVKWAAPYVLNHRIFLKPEARVTPDSVIRQILNTVLFTP